MVVLALDKGASHCTRSGARACSLEPLLSNHRRASPFPTLHGMRAAHPHLDRCSSQSRCINRCIPTSKAPLGGCHAAGRGGVGSALQSARRARHSRRKQGAGRGRCFQWIWGVLNGVYRRVMRSRCCAHTRGAAFSAAAAAAAVKSMERTARPKMRMNRYRCQEHTLILCTHCLSVRAVIGRQTGIKGR